MANWTSQHHHIFLASVSLSGLKFPKWIGSLTRFGLAGLLLIIEAFGLAVSSAFVVGGETGGEIGSNQLDQSHWAFQPPVRPDIPHLEGESESTNPIDAFLSRERRAFGLEASPEADRATLLRRLSFDLIGLPPTPEEQEAYLGDESSDAYERQVDRLLASPHYGERWAQHWLDLARYADTDGFEFDEIRPNMWRYRDWVVEALNSDMPYDEFVRLQIAGDELAPDEPSAFIATGFQRCYPDMVDLNDQGLRRQNALDDLTETNGLVFLGLTFGCARCHDHKFDPITQSDFFGFQAFFSPAQFEDHRPIATDEEQAQFESERRGWEAEIVRLEAAIRETSDADRKSELEADLHAARIAPPVLPDARGLIETSTQAPPTYLLIRGDYQKKGPEVAPAYPRVLVDPMRPPEPTSLPTSFPSSGRRSALARWLTHPNNPLTARVAVNRLWQHHFGRGLVATPSDFGTQGDPPTHPELLDWLACELVERGWSLKAMHRLIVNSAAYRQTSLDHSRSRAIDPDNLLLWRQNRRRLDGEAIRDALLVVSGHMNRKLGGPSIFPELPAELIQLSSKGSIWPLSSDLRSRDRRSLYVFVRRNLRYPFFEAFDRPDTNASCPRRPVTTIAPQALVLLNGSQSHHSARGLASRLNVEAGTDPAQRVDYAFRIALGRSALPVEQDRVVEFVSKAGANGWVHLGIALLNLNEFVHVD